MFLRLNQPDRRQTRSRTRHNDVNRSGPRTSPWGAVCVSTVVQYNTETREAVVSDTEVEFNALRR